MGIVSGEDHSGMNRMGRMPTPVILIFAVIAVYVQYWTIRYAVRHALSDADERRSKTGSLGRFAGA
jgi:hypothetical protein